MTTETRRLSGGQTVVAALAAAGVRHVFGIPGVHNLYIYDALLEQDVITSVVTRHEGGAGFMADGYWRASGRPAAVVVITGPGCTNVLTPVAEAYGDHSAMLVVATDVESYHHGQYKGFVHELKRQKGMFEQITQWTRRADTVPDVAVAIAQAMGRLQRQPQPIYVELPMDLQKVEAEVHIQAPVAMARTAPDPAALAEAARLLAGAQKPLILAGFGVIPSGAEAELAALAAAVGAPVVVTAKGKGAIPADHPLYAGCYWAKEINAGARFKDADVVLAVGTNLSSRIAHHAKLPIPPGLIHLDIDHEELGRNYPPAVGLVGDAKLGLAGLLAAFRETGAAPRAGLAEAALWRQEAEASLVAKAPEIAEWLGVMRRALPRETVVVADSCLAGMWACRYLPIYQPRTWQFPMEFGTLGYALPAAIGAKLACPDKPVVAISGDGGLQFTMNELAVAADLKLDLPLLIFNNSLYGSVKVNAGQTFGRAAGVELRNPDFVKLAEAYGVRGVRLNHHGELAGLLPSLLEPGRGVTVVDVPGHFINWY